MNYDQKIVEALVSMGVTRTVAPNVVALFNGIAIASQAPREPITVNFPQGVTLTGSTATNVAPKAKRTRKAAKRATKRATADVQATILAKVKSGTAYSGKEIASLTGIGQPTVDRAIKALREAKKLWLGGERRFSFYATSKQVAEAAAASARSGKAKKKAPRVNTKRKHGANGVAATA